jgi:hypothetical protein
MDNLRPEERHRQVLDEARRLLEESMKAEGLRRESLLIAAYHHANHAVKDACTPTEEHEACLFREEAWRLRRKQDG